MILYIYFNHIAICMCNSLKFGLSTLYLREQKIENFNLLKSSGHLLDMDLIVHNLVYTHGLF